MIYQPDTVVEASDRQYIADRYGSLRVLKYYTPEQVADRNRHLEREQAARIAAQKQQMDDLIGQMTNVAESNTEVVNESLPSAT